MHRQLLALLLSWGFAATQTLPPSSASTPSFMSQPQTSTSALQNTIVSPTTLLRTNLSSSNPLAVCNDGSPGFYYHRPGTGDGSRKWVVLFSGGGFCSDQQTCLFRATSSPNLMGSSARFYPDVLAGGTMQGVLDGDIRTNPNMFTWNHVWVGYCSSDSFLGNAGPDDSPENGSFQFRGQQIANTTFLSLLASKNLGDATDILITGVSAGAVGVLNLADSLYDIVQPKAPDLVNFKAYVDAGWFLDIPSYSLAPSAFTFRKTAQAFFYNFKATFNRACMAAHPGQEWACFFAQYAWAYVRTPLIIHEYLYDGASLGYDAVGSQENLNDFRSRLAASMAVPADEIPPVRNETVPSGLPPNGAVSTQSVAGGPQAAADAPSASSNVTIGASVAGPPNALSSPMAHAIPPAMAQAQPPGIPPNVAPPPQPRMSAADVSGLPQAAPPLGRAVAPAVFAPACSSHNVADNDLFSISHVGPTRFVDVLHAWFRNGTAEGLPLIDSTVGIASPLYCLRVVT